MVRPSSGSKKSVTVSDLYQLSDNSDERSPHRRKKVRRKKKADDAPVEQARRESLVEFGQSLQHTVSERAKESSIGWLLFVFVLTTSLAFDAIFRAGFVPMLFNGLTYLNFVVHELGHLACSFVPMWLLELLCKLHFPPVRSSCFCGSVTPLRHASLPAGWPSV